MHHTRLHIGKRPSRADRIRQTIQPVAADDEGVVDATVSQLAQHARPELRSFTAGRPNPQAEDVAFAVHVNADRHIDRQFAAWPTRS